MQGAGPRVVRVLQVQGRLCSGAYNWSYGAAQPAEITWVQQEASGSARPLVKDGADCDDKLLLGADGLDFWLRTLGRKELRLHRSASLAMCLCRKDAYSSWQGKLSGVREDSRQLETA